MSQQQPSPSPQPDQAPISPDLVLPPPGLTVQAIGVGQARSTEGKDVVSLQVFSILGPLMFSLEPATARKVGADLQKLGSASASGLFLAGGQG